MKTKIIRYDKTAAWRLGIQVEPALWNLYRIGWMVTLAAGRTVLRVVGGRPERAYRSLLAAEVSRDGRAAQPVPDEGGKP